MAHRERCPELAPLRDVALELLGNGLEARGDEPADLRHARGGGLPVSRRARRCSSYMSAPLRTYRVAASTSG
jgi:hypothetical protein